MEIISNEFFQFIKCNYCSKHQLHFQVPRPASSILLLAIFCQSIWRARSCKVGLLGDLPRRVVAGLRASFAESNCLTRLFGFVVDGIAWTCWWLGFGLCRHLGRMTIVRSCRRCAWCCCFSCSNQPNYLQYSGCLKNFVPSQQLCLFTM